MCTDVGPARPDVLCAMGVLAGPTSVFGRTDVCTGDFFQTFAASTSCCAMSQPFCHRGTSPFVVSRYGQFSNGTPVACALRPACSARLGCRGLNTDVASPHRHLSKGLSVGVMPASYFPRPSLIASQVMAYKLRLLFIPPRRVRTIQPRSRSSVIARLRVLFDRHPKGFITLQDAARCPLL